MKKILIRIGIIVFVLAIIAGIVVVMFLGDIVKKGVETAGPMVTKVDVKLNKASISLLGSAKLKGLFVGNPPGYKTDSAIKVGDVSVIIGDGGHMVLVTYVNTDVSPLSNFWANINYFYYRDPLIYEGGYPYTSNKVIAYYSSWRTSGGAFNEYGYNAGVSATAPNCAPNDSNCRDEARTGYYIGWAWWGRWVTIERDLSGTNPDEVYHITW